MAYLARLYVAGEAGPLTQFIEGYGAPSDFGIEWVEESEMTAFPED